MQDHGWRVDAVLDGRLAIARLRDHLLAVAFVCLLPSAAGAQVYAEELRITGMGPDIALSGGGGIGVGNSLDSNVMGRLRMGGVYFYEPFIFNLGATGQLGALAERGVGLELEINHFGGSWLQLGVSRVAGDDWMSSVALGLIVFGVEWQHRFDSPRDNAVLFLVRLPLGIWWFLLDHDAAEDAARRPARPAEPEPTVRQ